MDPTRTGPHGGYNTGTSKCSTCHSVHAAAGDGLSLLPAATIIATCNTCHDGTGGGGVYGVIKRVTDEKPFGHRVGFSLNGQITVPGGDENGGSLDRTFGDNGGGLTCTDCHSPHAAGVVGAFVGDRVRSSADTTSANPTNRLLRVDPGRNDVTVDEYGTEWCQACHQGRGIHKTNHPVASMTTTFSANYNAVQRMDSYDSTTVAASAGPLGGSNLGYVVPEGTPGLPICQQCHEDARDIANDLTRPFLIDGDTEAFEPSLDGVPSSGNPQFQNFPHETVNKALLIEERDSLCLNCHLADGGP